MPRNVYFDIAHREEQHLFEDLTIEALKIYGQETLYLPRQIVQRDNILTEDIESQYLDAYGIEMYVEDIEGFGGEGNLMQKFGLEIRDETTFIVAKRSWEKLVGTWNNTVDNFRPNEGDLIYLPMSQSFFEISFVEHEQPFYQLNNLPVYKLQCRLFEYNSEDFRTGIDEIDQIETVHAVTETMLIRDITGEIEIGQRLYQVLTRDSSNVPVKWISGVVTEQDTVAGALTNIQLQLTDIEMSDGEANRNFFLSTTGDTDTYLIDTVAEDDNGDPVTPSVTAEIYTLYDIDSPENRVLLNDNNAQNFEFEDLGDDIIDFSESNPFGEPS
jgi:hypothetical protein